MTEFNFEQNELKIWQKPFKFQPRTVPKSLKGVKEIQGSLISKTDDQSLEMLLNASDGLPARKESCAILKQSELIIPELRGAK